MKSYIGAHVIQMTTLKSILLSSVRIRTWDDDGNGHLPVHSSSQLDLFASVQESALNEMLSFFLFFVLTGLQQ